MCKEGKGGQLQEIGFSCEQKIEYPEIFLSRATDIFPADDAVQRGEKLKRFRGWSVAGTSQIELQPKIYSCFGILEGVPLVVQQLLLRNVSDLQLPLIEPLHYRCKPSPAADPIKVPLNPGL
jgi:hypothetical protein